MSSPIPPVRITFTADDTNVAAALRDVQSALRRVQAEAGRTTAATSGIASGTDRMAAGFRRASQALTVGTAGAQRWVAGLHALEAQQIQTAQASARLSAAVHPIAAQMAQAASGSELFARGLRNINAQGLGFRAGIPGLERANRTVAQTTPILAEATGALRSLGIAYGAVEVGRFVTGAIRDAAALNDLSQATGITVETLSILQVGAERADVTVNTLERTTRRLALALGRVRDGNREAIEDFETLGIAARDLEGLTVDQVFLRVARAVGELPDGMEKAEIASRLFGRAGVELIPLLNELRGDGFERLADEARRLGAVVDTETAASADEFGDRVSDLTAAMRGLVRTFVGPLLPALTEFANLLASAGQQAGSLVRTLRDLPSILPSLPFGIGGPLNLLQSLAAQRATTQTPPAPVAASAPGPTRATEAEIRALAELREAGRATETQQERIREIVRQLEADYAKAADDVVRQAIILKQIELLTKRIKTETSGARDARREELALLRQQAQETVRVFDAIQVSLAGAETEARADFDAGLLSLRQFFARRSEILFAATDAEIAQLEAQRSELLRAIELPATEGQTVADRRAEVAQLQGQVADLDARIATARERAQQTQAQLDSEEADAAFGLLQRRLDFELQIQQAKGQTLGVALVAINEEAQAFDRLLGLLDVEAGLRQERVRAFREALTLQAQAADVQRQVEEEFGALSRERQAIEDRLLTGKLTERQATEQIARLERDRLPALRALADEMARLAAETGDPDLAQQAAQLTADLNSLAAASDLASQRAAAFREALADAVQSDLTQFLGDTITRVETLEEAFLELGRAIASTFQRAFAERLVDDIRRAVEGFGSIELPEAPGGLTAADATEAARLAPDLAQEAASATQEAAVLAQEQVAAAQLLAAGTGLTAAGGTLAAAGGTLTAAGGTLTASGGALGAAGGTLGAAGVGLGAAATALSAAAAALLAAAGSDTAADFAGSAAAAFASGGPVPGTGSGDTVRAMLTPGEYVQTTRAVRYYGADVMEAMRRLKIPREVFKGVGRYHLHVPTSRHFATGGFVAGEMSRGGTSTLIVDLPEGAKGSVQSDDDTLRVIVRNRRKIRDVLR